MFPWSPEFVWDAAHLAFFGALYGVLLVVGSMLVTAALRARKGLTHADAFVWHAAFEDLPVAARACRHHLTGEAPGRTCDNGFDCRSCASHPVFLSERARSMGSLGLDPRGSVTIEEFGLSVPLDRYYHRGHTWVRPADDGTVTVGLDQMARRVAGTPEAVELPAIGSQLKVNGTGCHMRIRGSDVRVLAPVEGEVLEAGGDGTDWMLRVKPSGATDLRHLLAGDEVRVWVLRELERLEQGLGLRDVGRSLADGGELVHDLSQALPRAQYDAVLGAMFLEP